MFNPKSFKRPGMEERFKKYFLELEELREVIEETRALYEETGSERALALYRRFEWILRDRKSAEEIYQAEELQEFWANPSKWSHSVRTWYMDYRNKELEL